MLQTSALTTTDLVETSTIDTEPLSSFPSFDLLKQNSFTARDVKLRNPEFVDNILEGLEWSFINAEGSHGFSRHGIDYLKSLYLLMASVNDGSYSFKIAYTPVNVSGSESQVPSSRLELFTKKVSTEHFVPYSYYLYLLLNGTKPKLHLSVVGEHAPFTNIHISTLLASVYGGTPLFKSLGLNEIQLNANRFGSVNASYYCDKLTECLGIEQDTTQKIIPFVPESYLNMLDTLHNLNLICGSDREVVEPMVFVPGTVFSRAVFRGYPEVCMGVLNNAVSGPFSPTFIEGVKNNLNHSKDYYTPDLVTAYMVRDYYYINKNRNLDTVDSSVGDLFDHYYPFNFDQVYVNEQLYGNAI